MDTPKLLATPFHECRLRRANPASAHSQVTSALSLSLSFFRQGWGQEGRPPPISLSLSQSLSRSLSPFLSLSIDRMSESLKSYPETHKSYHVSICCTSVGRVHSRYSLGKPRIGISYLEWVHGSITFSMFWHFAA